MKKLSFKSIISISVLGISLFFYLSNTSIAADKTAKLVKLPIPPLIDSKEININIQKSQHEFYPGVKSNTFGYNGSFLGPTIKLHKGQKTTITYNNKLDDVTTVHGHGLHVPGRVDGGPQDFIKPNSSKTVELNINQDASTSWYHPHRYKGTAYQVHYGLAGMYIIEDDNSENLDLPNIYGLNDIPVVVQDRDFKDGKMLGYRLNMHTRMHGKINDTLIVNGAINPYHEVGKGLVRLRLLNGANATTYNFTLDSGKKFYVIAGDGGFLNEPVELTNLYLTPGERAEIVIDLQKDTRLLAELISPSRTIGSGRILDKQTVINFITNSKLASYQKPLPKKLNNIKKYDKSFSTKERTFSLSSGMRSSSINKLPMDISELNFNVEKGKLELWKVNADFINHPFHIHGLSYQILSINGKKPPKEFQGWKDTVRVDKKSMVELLVRFDYEATKEFPYMMHCHILEHEDAGMMWQFSVQDNMKKTKIL